jgi:lipoate-protein ligase A
MDLDRKLFSEFAEDPAALPLLRVYRVSEPGVTVGCSYRGKKQFCVRPTGGGLVKHGNDFIYSVIARPDTFPTFRQVRTSYLTFHEVVQEALQRLGFETSLFRCDDPKAKKNVKPQKGTGYSLVACPLALRDCFSTPVPTDVALGGQKIAGAAQKRTPNAFLHQGSIQIPRDVAFEDVKTAFVPAFGEKFGVAWFELK